MSTTTAPLPSVQIATRGKHGFEVLEQVGNALVETEGKVTTAFKDVETLKSAAQVKETFETKKCEDFSSSTELLFTKPLKSEKKRG